MRNLEALVAAASKQLEVVSEIHFEDKSKWGDGPWQNEPDKVQMVDRVTDLDIIIRRSPSSGAWCGYVGVNCNNPCHPLNPQHQKEAQEELSVHGGVTFANFCLEEMDEKGRNIGICHVPRHGHPDEVFWIGFDCGHGGDVMPRFNNIDYPGSEAHFSWMKDGTYKTTEYAKAMCALLAVQLFIMQPPTLHLEDRP